MLDERRRELARRIMAGKVPWEGTFEHPVYGPLTFKAHLPKAPQIAAQSVEVDNLLAHLQPNAEARVATLMRVTAIAALKTFFELPVVDHEVIEDDEDGIETKVVETVYDPEQEPFEDFMLEVAGAFTEWRNDLLNPEKLEENVDAVKNSSGGTPGSESADSSSATTGSPQATPA